MNELTRGVDFFNQYEQNKIKWEYKSIPGRGKILVCAPHPDDDIIGCGGTICKHVLLKDDIEVLFFTTGATKDEPDYETLVMQRREESKNALRNLGENIKATYLSYPANSLCDDNQKILGEVEEYIRRKQPSIIYVPNTNDRHIDHWMCNQILSQVLFSVNFNPEIIMYSVWSPIIPNLLINITDTFQFKMLALQCYYSQLAEYRFDKLIHYAAGYYMNLYHPLKTWRICIQEKQIFTNPILPWMYAEPYKKIEKDEYLKKFISEKRNEKTV